MDQIPAGYPRAAAYQSYDADYLIFRKFVYLRNRVILNTQDELAELEEELESLDNFDRDSAPERLYSRRRDVDLGPRRKELLQKIEDKLRVYGG